jgi:putative peptidoglycan lipid II flippase
MGPRVLTIFCIQFIFLATDNLASRLASGSVTSLVYGWLFMQVPETLIATAIGVVLLPTLSEQISRGEIPAFRQTMSRAIRILFALTIPTAMILAIVIEPVIGILNFDAAGTQMVVWVTRAYMLGMLGHALNEVAVRSFYAQQNARTPLFTAALTAVTFVLLAIPLAFRLGPAGIALANSLAFTAQAFILLWLLNRRFANLLDLRGDLLPALLRIIPAALLGALVAFGIQLLPLPSLFLAVIGAAAGALVAIPFILPELKLLVKL